MGLRRVVFQRKKLARRYPSVRERKTRASSLQQWVRCQSIIGVVVLDSSWRDLVIVRCVWSVIFMGDDLWEE